MTTNLVDATGTRRRLQALAAAGWSLADLADILGCSRQHVSALRNDRTHVHPDTARTITDLYGWLTACPAPIGRRAHRTAFTARRTGWATPADWAGVDIDDPTTQPVTNRPDNEDDQAA